MPKGGPDPYRVLGSSVLASDLHAVTFNGTHVFQEGETVLVPRTRGGFTYGQVDRIYPKRIQCHLDKAVSHSILEYQVVVEEYPEVIVKGLPAAYIGKLKLSESPYDEDDDSEDRIVGGSPLVTDLRNMVFGSSKTGIPPGEIVLVPRSKGGFTYGMVSKQLNLTCSLSDQPRHSVPGIRVLLEDESASDNPLHKDLLFIFLGRLSFGQITTSSSKGGLPLQSPKHHPGVALMSTKLPLSSSTGKKGAASTSSNSEMCGECEEEKAVFECQNCDEFYCEACCGDVHSKGKRKLHKDIVRLEEQHSQPSTPHQLPTSSITSSSFNNATQLSQPALKGSGRGVKASPAKVAAKQQKQPKPAPKAPPVGTSVLAAKLMAPDEDSEEEESEEEEEEDEEEIKPVAKAPFQIKAPPMKNVPPLAAPPFKAPPSSSKPPPPTALAKKAALAQEEEEEEESEEESEEEEEEETPQAPVPSLMKSVVLPRPLPKVGPQPSMADAVTLKRPPPIKKAGPPSSTPTSTLPLVKKASPPPPPPSLPPPSSPSPPPPPPPPKEEEEEEKSEEEEESEEEEPVKAVPSKSLPAPSKITAPGGVKTPAPKFAPPKTASKQVIPFKPSSSISSLLPTPAPTPKPTPPPAQTQAPSFKPVVPAGLDPNDWETDSEEEEEEEEKSTEEGGGGNSFSSSTFSKNSFPRPSNAASVPDVLGSVLKIDYNGKVVSLKHDGSDSFTALLKNVTDTFGLSKDTKLNVKYKDDEGDLVTMSSDREFGHAKQLVDDIYIIIAPGS